MAKQPSFQFYPGDWLKDAELRVCSHFARGLLVDLLCIMFEAKHRGRLCKPDGVTPWTDEQIVDTSSGGSREAKLAALSELESNAVLKRDEHGVLYSSRLVRDEEIREERRESGSKGGSKTQANRKQTQKQTEQQKQSSSSSSSSSASTEEIHTPTPARLIAVEVHEAIKTWNAYWQTSHGCGKPDSEIRVDAMLARAMSAGWGPDKIVEAIQFGISKNAKSWLDPDADFEKLAKERASRPSANSKRATIAEGM